MRRLWKVRHEGCGWHATRRRRRTALAASLLSLFLLGAPHTARGADSFVRRLAERALERGISQEARGDIAQALRLGSLRQRMGDRAEAELLYTHAIAAPETSADAYYARALLRDAAKERGAALLDLAQSVARAPAAERLHLLGTWYVEARSWPAALAVWRALLAQAEASGDATALREARVTVAALSWLASDTDPVQAGSSSPDWARRSLARAARRTQAEAQGVRKLTP